MSEYKLSPAKKAEAEIIERKSRFIGYISPVSSEEEARAFIETIKEKHSDATHNVWAYVLAAARLPAVRTTVSRRARHTFRRLKCW